MHTPAKRNIPTKSGAGGTTSRVRFQLPYSIAQIKEKIFYNCTFVVF